MPFQLADTEREYENNVNLKREDVEALSEWVKKQPHLPTVTELQLILFIHSCYYRMEEVKTTIDNYFTVRTHFPELFACPREDVIKETLSVLFIRILPKLTPEGYVILNLSLTDYRPENYNNINHTKLISMVLTWYLHQHGSANGLQVILDTKGATLGHVTRINLMAMKHLLYYVQEAIPVRIKGLHVINVNPFTEKIIAILKPFMKKELISVMRFHSAPGETLYEYLPPDYLPEDYGGEGPTIRILQEEIISNILENVDFFKWHDTQKVDEKKRLRTTGNVNTSFGVDGTFKKLQID